MPAPPKRLITSPRTIELPPVIVQPGRHQAVAVQLDERRAGVSRLRGAVDDDRLGDRRQRRQQRDRPHAGCPGMLKTIVSRSPASAFESRIAWRSEPVPALFVFVTTISRPAGVTVVASVTTLSAGFESGRSDPTPIVAAQRPAPPTA